MASRWLKKTEVQELVEQFLGGLAKKYELSAEKVIQGSASLLLPTCLDYFKMNKKGVAFLSLSEITRDQAAAIREITLESCAQGPMKDGNVRRTLHLRLSDKVRCLELLGKFLKLFGKSVSQRRASQGNHLDPQLDILLRPWKTIARRSTIGANRRFEVYCELVKS